MKTKLIDNSYWVVPGCFMAGEYPGSSDEATARRRLRWLLRSGITTWLDLTEERGEGLMPYEALLTDEAARLERVVNHIRMPIQDFSTPEKAYMSEILDALDSLLVRQQVVYLHCMGGIGRTGMTVGCYLVRHGLSGEAALAQIAEWRKDTYSGATRSPETEEQCQMVLDWSG